MGIVSSLHRHCFVLLLQTSANHRVFLVFLVTRRTSDARLRLPISTAVELPVGGPVNLPSVPLCPMTSPDSSAARWAQRAPQWRCS